MKLAKEEELDPVIANCIMKMNRGNIRGLEGLFKVAQIPADIDLCSEVFLLAKGQNADLRNVCLLLKIPTSNSTILGAVIKYCSALLALEIQQPDDFDAQKQDYISKLTQFSLKNGIKIGGIAKKTTTQIIDKMLSLMVEDSNPKADITPVMQKDALKCLILVLTENFDQLEGMSPEQAESIWKQLGHFVRAQESTVKAFFDLVSGDPERIFFKPGGEKIDQNRLYFIQENTALSISPMIEFAHKWKEKHQKMQKDQKEVQKLAINTLGVNPNFLQPKMFQKVKNKQLLLHIIGEIVQGKLRTTMEASPDQAKKF